MSIIKVNNLTKTYKNGKGIFDLDFSVKEGEVFGYLGPNGAGKTTTIRQLMGFTNADKGSCTIMGLDCRTQTEEIQKSVGYLPGEIAFFDNMTGEAFLKFIKEMKSIEDKSRMHDLIERFELDPSRKIRKMSKGMKQKVGIISAFMHDPEVYILDEPTSGLDPLMQRNFINLINEEKSRGKTILMSSHIFEEIDKTSDRIGVIKEGRLVTVEDVHSIKASLRKIFIVNVGNQKDIDIIKSSGLEINSVTGNQIEIVVSSNYNKFNQVLAKCNVLGIEILNQSLEQVFMKYYG
ncbi:ABC transporter ATP-binding protein [Sporosalibacterium faouarense]|uniref:ABC transporter ATP-binding protein n=1 Tax=Sporosalibacterium faouarense TaxID=516123 RepID=UPI00192C57EF|nr:ABC transporter ATP-binding protein [Sporosalibacterium faouarense]